MITAPRRWTGRSSSCRLRTARSQTREHILLARQSTCRHRRLPQQVRPDGGPHLLELVELEVRELLSKYGFPATRSRHPRRVEQGARQPDRPDARHLDLAARSTRASRPGARDRQGLPPPIEDVFSISAAHGRHGPRRARHRQGGRRGRDRRPPRHDEEGRDRRRDVKKLLDQGQAATTSASSCAVWSGPTSSAAVLAKPGSIKPHTKFKGRSTSSPRTRGPAHAVLQQLPPQFFIRTTTSPAPRSSVGGRDGDAGRRRRARDRAHHPDRHREGMKFAIREGGRTVGAGTVTEILA